LEYRRCLDDDADPIFTLSCDLDERIPGTDGKSRYPAPLHRIPKTDTGATQPEDAIAKGKQTKRGASSRRKMPVGLRVLAIDLGMRHIATGAVVEFVDDGQGNGMLPNPLKPLAVEFVDVPGVTLSHIQRHQDERRRKQQQACPRGVRRAFEIRGAHLPRGQDFARELLDHAENLKDDRRKKAAHAILRAALEHHVDYIVFENLKGYRPDTEFGRRVNASLMTWNRRELVEFVRMEAAPLGVHVYDFVPPHHTSRFCHRCGAVGHRFTHVRAIDAWKDSLAPEEPVFDKDGKPLFDAKGKRVCRRKWTPQARRIRGTPLGVIAGRRQAIDGGKHFCCAECGLIINADYNAAMNLARKLADDFPAYQRYSYNTDKKTWVVDGQTLTREAFWGQAKARVQERLNGHFGQPAETPPAGGWPK
jgi:IS605 OrfB family transposase